MSGPTRSSQQQQPRTSVSPYPSPHALNTPADQPPLTLAALGLDAHEFASKSVTYNHAFEDQDAFLSRQSIDVKTVAGRLGAAGRLAQAEDVSPNLDADALNAVRQRMEEKIERPVVTVDDRLEVLNAARTWHNLEIEILERIPAAESSRVKTKKRELEAIRRQREREESSAPSSFIQRILQGRSVQLAPMRDLEPEAMSHSTPLSEDDVKALLARPPMPPVVDKTFVRRRDEMDEHDVDEVFRVVGYEVCGDTVRYHVQRGNKSRSELVNLEEMEWMLQECEVLEDHDDE